MIKRLLVGFFVLARMPSRRGRSIAVAEHFNLTRWIDVVYYCMLAGIGMYLIGDLVIHLSKR
jgi:hypothetical protein